MYRIAASVPKNLFNKYLFCLSPLHQDLPKMAHSIFSPVCVIIIQNLEKVVSLLLLPRQLVVVCESQEAHSSF